MNSGQSKATLKRQGSGAILVSLEAESIFVWLECVAMMLYLAAQIRGGQGPSLESPVTLTNASVGFFGYR